MLPRAVTQVGRLVTFDSPTELVTYLTASSIRVKYLAAT